MPRSASQLRADAERIWRAGVDAVLPERLVAEHVRVDGCWLVVGDESIDLSSVGRIVIVGAGKAAGAMVVALEDALGPKLLDEKDVTGWVNVPADCLVPTRRVHLHAGRPAGVNEPRSEGVEGAERILELVASLRHDDLCICVIAGGGSALLPAPVPEISLDDKICVTRLLSAAGANIEQLNTVRRQISRIKGGGLAHACRADRLVTLIISDVLGDPLDVIASGPTVPSLSTPQDALDVLAELKLRDEPQIAAVIDYLRKRCQEPFPFLPQRQQSSEWQEGKRFLTPFPPPSSRVTNLIIGNNATAVGAAGAEAERLGYEHAMISAAASEGPAEDVGRHLAATAMRMRRKSGPNCLISGGEPTVTLVDETVRGKGGRNQQLALAALAELGDSAAVALLAGGTDGEDGPTDAAGAVVTADVVAAARRLQLDPRDYLRRNDAYHFFAAAGGLLITGPTYTNVCDLRVVIVDADAMGIGRGLGNPGG
jgi:glycerate 2-kinase